jgi:hypothetical protein
MKESMKHAVITGAMLVLYGLVYRIADLETVPGLVWLFYLAIVICAGLTVMVLSRDGRGWVSCLGEGSLAGAVAALMYAVYVFVYNQWVDDSLLVQLQQDFIVTWEGEGVNAEEIRRRLQSVTFTPAGFAVQILTMMTVLAIATAGISTLFFQRYFRKATSLG